MSQISIIMMLHLAQFGESIALLKHQQLNSGNISDVIMCVTTKERPVPYSLRESKSDSNFMCRKREAGSSED